MRDKELTYGLRHEDGRVLCNDEAVLRRYQARVFSHFALPRKQLRELHAKGCGLIADLTQRGKMLCTVNVGTTKRLRQDRSPMVTIRGHQLDDRDHMYSDEFAIFCEGDLAEEIINRVNKMHWRKLQRMMERRERKCIASTKKRRDDEKRKRREETRQARQKPIPRKKTKAERPIIPAPLALEHNIREGKHRVTRQFRNSRPISLAEAVSGTAIALEVEASATRRPRAIIESRLCDSLDTNGGSFAQIKMNGFTIRFDRVPGSRRDESLDEWRFTISCTKDNTHRAYRRLRDHFSWVLIGLEERRQRILRPRASKMIQIAA